MNQLRDADLDHVRGGVAPPPGAVDARAAAAMVFGVCVLSLVLEMTASRLAAFYLTYSNSYLAIPLALFGLTLGSLRIHLGRRRVEQYDLRRWFAWLGPVTALCLAAIFLLFSRFFPLQQFDISAAVLAKLLLFCGGLIPPLYLCGAILTLVFTRHSERVALLYALDFTGAALACAATPLLLMRFDLPLVMALTVLVTGVIHAAIAAGPTWRRAAVAVIPAAGAFATLTWLEGQYDFHNVVAKPWSSPTDASAEVSQVAHRWNAYSRVAALRIAGGERSYYRIIHDNAESNVAVMPYSGVYQQNLAARDNILAAPWLLGRPVRSALVMFAGCGRQMLEIDRLSGGHTPITGVEINPLVIEMARKLPELSAMRLDEFFSRPNVRMVVNDGRAFLDQNRERFDLILVASDAATFQFKTSNSRKYLDTVEAMRGYLDHLSEHGLLVFQGQPAPHKLRALRHLFEARGRTNLDQCVAVFSAHWEYLDSIILSLTPFTLAEGQALRSGPRGRDKLLYAPMLERPDPKVTGILHDAPSQADLVTDDRPFVERLDLAGYRPAPGWNLLKQVPYYKSWIMISTLLLVTLVAMGLVAGSLALTRVRGRSAPPAGPLAYLLISGFCYMLCQIVLLARLELLLGNPLLSMALLLATFLIGNAIGSVLLNRLTGDAMRWLLPVVTALLVIVTVKSADWLNGVALHQAAPVKLLCAAALLLPLSMMLGGFYPRVVSWLADNGMPDAVPITYGISTLASVVGATYAMTAGVNLGYRAIAWQAAAGYLLLAITALVGWSARGRAAAEMRSP